MRPSPRGRFGDLVVRDPSQTVVVAVPARSFPEHQALGVGLIRWYGAKEPTVVAALLRLSATALGATGTEPDRWVAIEEQANLLVTAAEREVVEPADLVLVHAEHAALQRLLGVRRAAAAHC